MRKSRILLIHRDLTGFGDTIRMEQILKFLHSNSFDVHVVGLPIVNRVHLMKGKISMVLGSLFPFTMQGRPLGVKSLPFLFNLMIARNYLTRLSRSLEFDMVLAETSIAGWCALDLSLDRSVPLVVDVHGLAGFEGAGRGDEGWETKQLLEREVFENCHHLLAVSYRMKNCISKLFGISSDKITVIHNGADYPDLKAQFSMPLKVVFAGYFAHWERVDDYLETAKYANSSDFKFFLAGGGPLRKHIVERIRHENIPVQFLGKVPRPKILSLLTMMQVGIAPSTHDVAREVAFPIKVLDYLACGLPVVAPNVGDWGEMIEKEGCGIVLSDDSIHNYTDALESLKNRSSWEEKSSRAVVAIRERYSWKSVLEPLESLISGLAH
jgi:glycosyltransferase involved in cell wall biosynthesis